MRRLRGNFGEDSSAFNCRPGAAAVLDAGTYDTVPPVVCDDVLGRRANGVGGACVLQHSCVDNTPRLDFHTLRGPGRQTCTHSASNVTLERRDSPENKKPGQ